MTVRRLLLEGDCLERLPRPLRFVRSRKDPERNAAIVAGWNGGRSTADLARAHRISPASVHFLLLRQLRLMRMEERGDDTRCAAVLLGKDRDGRRCASSALDDGSGLCATHARISLWEGRPVRRYDEAAAPEQQGGPRTCAAVTWIGGVAELRPCRNKTWGHGDLCRLHTRYVEQGRRVVRQGESLSSEEEADEA